MKLIHCADLHLDSALNSYLDEDEANLRNQEILDSFKRLVDYALNNEVEIVLIAGDLFDHNHPKKNTLNQFLELIKEHSTIKFIYLKGNHDLGVTFNDVPINLYLFDDMWHTYCFDDIAISGRVMNNQNYDLIYDDLPIINGYINIITLHGELAINSGKDLINLNKLRNKAIDYLALDHFHSYIKRQLDDMTIIYPGCLEGRGFDECGAKGFVLLDISKQKIESEFIPFAKRTLHLVECDIKDCLTSIEVLKLMQNKAANYKKDDMLEFILKGEIEADLYLPLNYLKDTLENDHYFVKIKDNAKLKIDYAKYRHNISLKGEFLRQVEDKESSSKLKEAIIHTGFAVLNDEDFEE